MTFVRAPACSLPHWSCVALVFGRRSTATEHVYSSVPRSINHSRLAEAAGPRVVGLYLRCLASFGGRGRSAAIRAGYTRALWTCYPQRAAFAVFAKVSAVNEALSVTPIDPRVFSTRD